MLAKNLKKSGDSVKTQGILASHLLRSDKFKKYFKIVTFICLVRNEKLKLFPFFTQNCLNL